MKLKKLTIHNIASIEDAVIDFDAEPLSSSEVFLITGKTGAGKSTILDAICLALFANTPRLKNTQMEGKTLDAEKEVRISDPTQLMRRNTAEAAVTLTFVGSNETEYEAVWSVKRAGKKPTGNLQGKKWQLTNLGTGATLTKDREIQEEMKSAIGLDFNQFCRTTMLAQGEFTRFLNSKDEEKAAILEKITGVDVYSKIGRKVYEQTSTKEQLWRDARRLSEGIILLKDEEIADLNRQLTELTEEQKKLGVEREENEKKLQAILTFRNAIISVNKKIAETQAQLAKEEKHLNEVLKPGKERATKTAAEAEKAFAEQSAVLKSKEEELQKARLPELRKEKELFLATMTAVEKAQERLSFLEAERKRRIQAKATLEEMLKNLEKQKATLSDLLPKLRDAEVRRDTCKQLCERQRETVDKWAKNMRAKLHVGDICPVCQQKISAAIPNEAELDSLFRETETAWREAEKIFNELSRQQNQLNAEISTGTRMYENAKASYEKDDSIARNEQLATEACQACGIDRIDETTLSLLLKIHHTANSSQQNVEQKIKSAEEIERAVAAIRRQTDTLRNTKERAGQAVVDIDRSLLENEGRIKALTTLILSKKEEIAEAENRLKQLEENRMEEFVAKKSSLEKQINELGERRGAINLRLKQDAENKAKKSTLLAEEETRKQDFMQWSRLNQLIGDATGSKFRKIAQSYVLGSLIHAANSYMRTLTDRYTLLVEPGTFVISIEDAYQGFARRAASTISGGESFLVSLSLALALSDIGHRLAVDTLFIDEGFGTLSGEPLHAAIATLRSLHTCSGRHVGIISHIEELQDRIPVQIKVEQEGNNSSSKVRIVDGETTVIECHKSDSKQPANLTFKEKRAKYINAYEPWTEADETLLTQCFEQGMTIPQIMEIMGRNRGSIKSRLQKLGY